VGTLAVALVLGGCKVDASTLVVALALGVHMDDYHTPLSKSSEPPPLAQL